MDRVDSLGSASETFGSASRRVGIAVDSCALLTSDYAEANHIAIANMRIDVGDEEFEDKADFDYIPLYRRVSEDPSLRASIAAPKPVDWLETIDRAADGVDTVVCVTVAAGLSASYDSARVAAQMAKSSHPDVDVRVVDSGTISGAFKLMMMQLVDAVDSVTNANDVAEIIIDTKPKLRTVAAIDSLDRIDQIARAPKFALRMASRLSIKPVLTFDNGGFHMAGMPATTRLAHRRIFKTIEDDVEETPARFVVLHVDAEDRAEVVASEIRSRFDCQYIEVTDFHPFIGLYADRGAVGVAWQRV